MLEKEDLQALRAIIKEEITASEQRTDIKLAETKRDIMQGVAVLMDEHFEKKFNLLAEGHEMLCEKLEPLDDLPVWETRISALEAAVKKLNRDIAQLKKAQ